MMRKSGDGRLMVTRNRKLVGIVGLKDLMNALDLAVQIGNLRKAR